MLDSGRLRHRINIQRQDTSNAGGVLTRTWVNVLEDEPAEIKHHNARELIAAQAQNSQVSLTIVIRFHPEVLITAKHRAVHGSAIYNIHGVIPDPDSGIEYLTMPASQGTNDGS